jgi:hypothetical protein
MTVVIEASPRRSPTADRGGDEGDRSIVRRSMATASAAVDDAALSPMRSPDLCGAWRTKGIVEREIRGVCRVAESELLAVARGVRTFARVVLAGLLEYRPR